MSDFPISVVEPLPTIHPWSLESIGEDLTTVVNVGGAAAGYLYYTQSAVYPVANLALFVPFVLTKPVTVAKMFTYNGTVAAGNIDVGIYDISGTLIVSMGSVAQAGTSVIQSFDITDTQIGPGKFYMAIVENNVASTFFKHDANEGANRLRFTGMAQMAAAFPLPATATLALLTANYVPVFGLLISPRTVV